MPVKPGTLNPETLLGNGANVHTETQEHRDAAARTVNRPVDERVAAVTETTWPPLALALLRGALEGVVLTGVAVGALLAADGAVSVRGIAAVVLSTLFGRLAIALGVGQIDQWNAAREPHR